MREHWVKVGRLKSYDELNLKNSQILAIKLLYQGSFSSVTP